MTLSIEEVRGFFDAHDYSYDIKKDGPGVRITFNSKGYVSPSGEKAITLYVDVGEEGAFLNVAARGLYAYPDGPHRLAVLQACLLASYRSKLVSYEYDPTDGEIEASVEFFVEDAKVTLRQFDRMVSALLTVVDRNHPMIATAIAEGRLVTPEEAEGPKAEDVLALIARMKPDEVARLLKMLSGKTGAAPAKG